MCKGCWDYGPNIKDIKRGGVEIDDFDKEVNYKAKTKKKSRPAPQDRPGCPGNDNGPHVYVWTTELEEPTFFSDWWGFPKHKSLACAGCGKKRRSDYSDEYIKRKNRLWDKLDTPQKGVPVPRYYRARRSFLVYRYWSWELEDEEYKEARQKYLTQHGWTRYYYSGW